MSEKLKDQLLGTWRLISYVELPVDGSAKRYPMGQHPEGIILNVITNNSLAASSLMEALGSSLPERARRTRRPAPDVVRHPRITTVFVTSAGAGDRP